VGEVGGGALAFEAHGWSLDEEFLAEKRIWMLVGLIEWVVGGMVLDDCGEAGEAR
jgi:hypothetical protein